MCRSQHFPLYSLLLWFWQCSYFCILCLAQLELADVALKEEANKKAFEKFAKESSSNCSVETVQVSERYESQLLLSAVAVTETH